MTNVGKLVRSPIGIASANNYDLLAIIVFFIGGTWFLWNSSYWAGIVNVGNMQYGDAAFWWNGALHFAEGIIRDNPNLDFRMGYAMLAGLFVAVLGGNFYLFHKLLVVVFLFVAAVFYFALKPALGRIVAAGAIGLLIFNPFTAEWIAISTSDSVGLILNIAALSCFIFGLRDSLHLGFLAVFGFLLASASLTRPLMSFFIAPAIVIVAFYRITSWKKRFQGIASILAAFGVPTFLWVITLQGITGSWAMAGHDSTTFYAASDPQIQVWTGAMYDKVRDSARNRYKTQTITPTQLDKEFWLLTKENYQHNLGYHFSRALPHIFDIAKFSNQDMSKNNLLWDLVRRGIMAAVVVGLVFSALQKRRQGALLIGLVGLLIVILPVSQSIVILCGALLFAFSALRSEGDPAYAILAFYWWIGVVALFLVGGTWGPPLGAFHGINALGYRLGSQFFFINDLIVVAVLGLISTLRLPVVQPLKRRFFETGSSLQTVYSTKDAPKSYASILLSLATYIFISALIMISIAGAGVISYRVWLRSHEAPQSFPPLGQFQTWWQENQTKFHVATPLETVSNISDLRSKIGSITDGGTASSYILFTGGMSDFVWNMEAQERSQAIVYLQNNVSPLTMSPNLVYVEFPSHLDESKWVRKQGAWIVRRLTDLPLKSNLPFYFSETSVKAFVPLSTDKKHFDFFAAQIFPLQKYASQLYSSGELKVINGILEWNFTSGTERYPRRFLLKPEPTTNPPKQIMLELDISKAVGARSLSFKWLLERAPNGVQPIPLSILKVQSGHNTSGSPGKNFIYYTGDVTAYSQAIQSAQIGLTQSKHSKLEIVLDGVMSDDKIWVYELNLQSDEFLP